MKKLIFSLWVVFGLNGLAYTPPKTPTLQDVAKYFSKDYLTFRLIPLPENPPYLKSMERDHADKLACNRFETPVDWDPIHGLVMTKNHDLIGIEILSFSGHDGNGTIGPTLLQ